MTSGWTIEEHSRVDGRLFVINREESHSEYVHDLGVTEHDTHIESVGSIFLTNDEDIALWRRLFTTLQNSSKPISSGSSNTKSS